MTSRKNLNQTTSKSNKFEMNPCMLLGSAVYLGSQSKTPGAVFLSPFKLFKILACSNQLTLQRTADV